MPELQNQNPLGTISNASPPRILPTAKQDETYAGYTYHIQGELVPQLAVEIKLGQSVYFEHHIFLWKHPDVTVGVHPLKGAVKRMFAGLPICMTDAKGSGSIAFSRDGAGHVFGIHMRRGDELHVREHQFLAATDGLGYDFERVKGFKNMLLGGSGLFIDKFHCNSHEGLLWLHGYGNVFEKELARGEQIDIEPGAWVYKDPGVKMETNIQSLAVGFLAAAQFVTNRFTGPGRVAYQTMYLHEPTPT
jgi:uncharacterized protein (AIM24 family)